MIRLHFRWHTHECSVTKRFYCNTSNKMIRLHFRWHTHECSVTKRFYSLQCRRILAGPSALFPSNVQAAILNEENSGELGRGKKFTKPVGGRKKNWGGGRGRGKKNLFFLPRPPPPSTFAFSPQFSPSTTNPKWRLNTRKMKNTKTPTKTACTAG